jgi:ABC-type transport system involved in multi-copper enzyme maturation permease subunit
MAFAPGAWLKENAGVYVGNATAVRDYRVQLRGNRAVILWAVYLLVLIGFGMLTYSAAAGREEMSVVEAQASLQTFYRQIINLLSTMVMLIAPALTATAIVAERQRKSLDLVFSAPVSPKYYLVGKMISSYRYIWMLLVLSLPVTAACVVLGGASWSEVLATYGLMSLHGLIYTSIALLFSTLAQKPVGAIVWSYIGVFIYVIFVTTIAEGLIAVPTMMMGRSPTTSFSEMSFVVDLSPYAIDKVASSYTILFDYHVPNWLLAAGFTLLVSKLLLLGGASVLSPFGSPETKSLRLHGLIYMFLITLGYSAVMGLTLSMTSSYSGMSGPGGTPAAPLDDGLYFGRLLVTAMLPLMIVLPFVSCFGVDLEKKFWPDGVFNLRRTLLATPAGGLPYIFALVCAAAAGVAVYSNWRPGIMSLKFYEYAYFTLALFFVSWSVGRLTSAMNNGLRYARTLQFTILLLVMALPIPFLAIADPGGWASTDPSIWDLYVLRPLVGSGDTSMLSLVYGTVFVVVGLLLVVGSERLAKARYSRVGLTYGRS